ncbi:MAG: hypothetical protein GY894_00055 [Planctomycetes bacterium]|nr:hypothetical protein [Planctomycetota bacterium]MCP4837742.1 hypothetical protein [Planctomycetota bacterium]
MPRPERSGDFEVISKIAVETRTAWSRRRIAGTRAVRVLEQPRSMLPTLLRESVILQPNVANLGFWTKNEPLSP